MLNGDPRQGDNLYTCSIVALNPDTGKLVQHFQPSPHDTHDWDAVQTPVLFDDVAGGVRRKLLAQGSGNGCFFVLDRSTGEQILTRPFIPTNWAEGIDSHGQPRPRKDKEPKPDGVLVSPGSDGATNWMASSFDPDFGLFYLSARRLWSMFYMTAEGKPEGWAGRDRNLWAQSVIEALNYRTGEIRWKHEIGNGQGIAGILTTAGKLLFTGDNSDNLRAVDPRDGAYAVAYQCGRPRRVVADDLPIGRPAVSVDSGRQHDSRVGATVREVNLRTGLLLFGVLIIASLAGRPPIADHNAQLLAGAQVPPDVRSIIERACRDCHSDDMRYPWYSYVAPASWLIGSDVRSGRKHLNFSRWNEYSTTRRMRCLSEIANQVQDRGMPLAIYTLMHREARLSDSDINALFQWTQNERARLIAQNVSGSK